MPIKISTHRDLPIIITAKTLEKLKSKSNLTFSAFTFQTLLLFYPLNIAEEKFGIKVEQFMRKKDSAVVDDDETLEDLIFDADKRGEELWLIALTTETTILAKTELASEIQDIKTQKRQHNRLVEIFANLRV